MFDPFEKDILTISNSIQNNDTTSVSLTEYFLERIDLYDRKGPCLNSIIACNPRVLDEAKKLDKERQAGKIRSILHGIPVVIKDNIDFAGMPATAGSLALENSYPVYDAFIIKKLREAGAVIIAKTSLTEFARHGVTVNSLIGQTRNPYDLSRTPGGSSGGTGAAVAANLAVAGLGTDTVNSIRSPASANNLVGIRPTTGLLSRIGLIPCSGTQDTAGPLARTVADAAILLGICAGYDPADPKTAEQTGREHCDTESQNADYLKSITKKGAKDKRIGLIQNNFGDHPDVLAVMDHAINVLRELGANIVPLSVPEFESSALLKSCDTQLFETKPCINKYFDSIPECPVKNLNDLVSGGKLHKSIYDDMKSCAEIENPMEQSEYFVRLYRISQKRALAFQIMAEHKLDAFLYPHQQIPAEPIVNQSQRGRNGILASIIGFPAITLPGGFSKPDQTAPLGVPIGIEFMARPYKEQTLFEIASAFEFYSPHRSAPVSTP